MMSINNNFAQQLANFCAEWQANVELSVESNMQKFQYIPDAKKLQQFFTDYQQITEGIEQEKAEGKYINVWQIANIGQNEVRNSKVLRWFLDMYADHGQGKAFLNALFESIHLSSSLPTLTQYRTTAESHPLGEISERVDIEIEAENLLVFIEVKINAIEGDKQLERYLDNARIKAGNRTFVVIYLTRDGLLPINYRNRQDIIGLSWKKLATAFTQYIRRINQQVSQHKGIWLAEQFIQHILTF